MGAGEVRAGMISDGDCVDNERLKWGGESGWGADCRELEANKTNCERKREHQLMLSMALLHNQEAVSRETPP